MGAVTRPLRDRGRDHDPRRPAAGGPRRPVDDCADEEGAAPARTARDTGDSSDRRRVPRRGGARAWGRDRPYGRARPVVRRPARPPAPGASGSAWSRRCGRRSRSAPPFALRGRRRTVVSCSPRRISSCRRRSAPADACCSRGQTTERIQVVEPGIDVDRFASRLRSCRRGPSDRVARPTRLGEGPLRRDQSTGGGRGGTRGSSSSERVPSGTGCSATPTISGSATGSRSGPSRTTRCRRSSPAPRASFSPACRPRPGRSSSGSCWPRPLLPERL